MGRITERLLEAHRDINVDDTWWDSVYENWIAKLADLGINLDATDISFSGFWSQGDGASFTCRLNMQVFIEQHGLADQYPAAWYWARKDSLSGAMVRCSRQYNHEHTVHAEVELYSMLDYEAAEEGEVRAVVDVAMADKYHNDECDGLEDDINSICRGYMRDIYNDLEEEHEYLTSDEVVRQTLEANEIFDDEDDEDEETGGGEAENADDNEDQTEDDEHVV